MGFLQAIRELGEMANLRYRDSPLSDIINYLQLPYALSESEEEKTHVIRIWLDVTDPMAEILDIHGIKKIDKIEYGAIGDDRKIKERCIYRDPVGSNATWRFTPLYKLGVAVSDPVSELLKNKQEEEEEENKDSGKKKSRLYSLKRSVLQDYEKSHRFTEGSVDRIMADITKMISTIAELWSDTKRVYFLLFGIDDGGTFLYPGEVPVFVEYFRTKLKASNLDNQQGKKQELRYCSLCGEQTNQLLTLDKVLRFSTFDKENFLPGIKRGDGVMEKVFPVCRTCYGLLEAGFEEMENRFVSPIKLQNVKMLVIPEILSDKQQYFAKASDRTRNFLTYGIKQEEHLFNNLAQHDEGLVYHFLFAQEHQAQLVIHSLVEDVPPTRLKKVEKLWIETCKIFEPESTDQDNRYTLDAAIKQIIAILLSLAGANKQEQTVMLDESIAVISALLADEPIRVNGIKLFMVSRFPGLFSTHTWIAPKGNSEMPGRIRLRGMAEMVDFLLRVNRRV